MRNREKDTIPMVSDPSLEKLGHRPAHQRSSSSWASPNSKTAGQEPIFYTQPMSRKFPESRALPPKSGGGHHRELAAPPADETGGHQRENPNQLLNSGQLGLCSDPYCTICPGAYQSTILPPTGNFQSSNSSWAENPKERYKSATNRARNWLRVLNSKFILNPHNSFVQRWNKFFVISCLVAVFIDPLFFFVLSVNEDLKCMFYRQSFAVGIAVVRSATDFVYFLHILFQFRLAYVAPESRIVGTGDWVFDPRKIAVHYLRGYFALDAFVVLPLPQVMILAVIPAYWGPSAANFAKNLLRASVLLQYVPRIFRILPLISGGSSSGFIFESAWSNFVINLLMFVLAGHVVGSCWYLFGLQRVNKCLQEACSNTNSTSCWKYLDCRREYKFAESSLPAEWESWSRNDNAASCLSLGGPFNYGIYQQAPVITKRRSVIVRYVYSLFWGFQQISTLAGNQVPSDFVWEVLFTMSIIALGLLLFALLIGNIQNFLQSLGRRRLEMQLRQRDVEQWMTHRRLSPQLMRKVQQSERFSWSATRGVNEEQLMENLPENLQKEIRRHLFVFLKEVRIFSLMDEPILDAFRTVLTQKLYLVGSYVQERDGPIDKMVFIVRGQMESLGMDKNPTLLREGDVCGEELLAWHLEAISKDEEKIRSSRLRLFSNRDVRCITNVEAFVLLSSDMEDVIINFENFLRKPSVQGAIRYKSAYWRSKAARHIQIVWRHRRWRLMRKVNAHDCQRHHHLPPRR